MKAGRPRAGVCPGVGGWAPVLVVIALAGCLPMQDPPPTEAIPELVIVTPTIGPPATPERAVAGRYVVQQGDTLSDIAARFGVAEAELMAANDLRDPNRLFAGQVLVIPAPPPEH